MDDKVDLHGGSEDQDNAAANVDVAAPLTADANANDNANHRVDSHDDKTEENSGGAQAQGPPQDVGDGRGAVRSEEGSDHRRKREEDDAEDDRDGGEGEGDDDKHGDRHRSKKRKNKVLYCYLLVPVLWCAALYFGVL